jgi:pyruvate kinase
MVARGDLGVEMPIEEVPPIQKKIIRKCREHGKPVVVATQMLESMTQNPSPTRAEASDVANAAYEGADVLMLSAESASGKYPVEAVAMMDSIIKRVETSSAWRPLMNARPPEPEPEIGDSITSAANMVAETVDACCIVTFTASGSTAVRMSRQRPLQPVLLLTPNLTTARRFVLGWGLHSRVAPDPTTLDDLVAIAVEKVRAEGIGTPGQHIVLTAGIPFGVSGSTNMLRVVTLA